MRWWRSGETNPIRAPTCGQTSLMKFRCTRTSFGFPTIEPRIGRKHEGGSMSKHESLSMYKPFLIVLLATGLFGSSIFAYAKRDQWYPSMVLMVGIESKPPFKISHLF